MTHSLGRSAATVLLCLSLGPTCRAQKTMRTPGQPIKSALQLRLTPTRRSYLPTQEVWVVISVSNRGSNAVYVQRTLDLCQGPWGGIELRILDSGGRRVPRPTCVGDPYHVDIANRNLPGGISDTWVLLAPGYSYSLRTPIDDFPSARG